jgi:hypothetical protein
MPLERKKGPSTCGRGVGPEREPPGRPQHYLSADTLPLAISWVKGDRPIILGEIFWRDGRVCLGTHYKRRRAWCIPLSRLAKAPVRNGERCVGLKDMEPAPWVQWPYAERTVGLLELVQEERQLPLEVRA